MVEIKVLVCLVGLVLCSFRPTCTAFGHLHNDKSSSANSFERDTYSVHNDAFLRYRDADANLWGSSSAQGVDALSSPAIVHEKGYFVVALKDTSIRPRHENKQSSGSSSSLSYQTNGGLFTMAVVPQGSSFNTMGKQKLDFADAAERAFHDNQPLLMPPFQSIENARALRRAELTRAKERFLSPAVLLPQEQRLRLVGESSRQKNATHFIGGNETEGTFPPPLPTANSKASLFSDFSSAASVKPTPLKIAFRFENLNHTDHFCTNASQMVVDHSINEINATIACDDETILTEERKNLLVTEVLPRAARVLNQYLSVIYEYPGVRVPPQICGHHFIIPPEDSAVGVGDANYVVYVSAGPAPEGTIAYAGLCGVLFDGRPIIGRANFSPKYLVESKIATVVRVSVHELLHALGFSMPFIKSQLFGIPNAIDYSQTRRGGQTVTLYKGPAAVEAAKKHFGCSALDGVELENEGGEGTAGSHWERRYHSDDIMAGIVGNVMAFSEMTFGLLEDSGHYFINRSEGISSEPPAISFPPPSAEAAASNDGSEAYRNGPNNGLVPNVRSNFEIAKYMHRAGCGMMSSKCNTPEGGAGDYFCFQKSPAPRVCTRDYSAIGSCYVVTYASNLPAWARYFDDPRMGGMGQLYNYCPLISSYENRICNDNRNVDANSSQYALYFARDGRCFETSETMIKEGYVFPPNETPGTARCLRARCPGGKRIEFAPSSSGPWAACPSDGSAGTVPAPTGYVGSVTCPTAVPFCTQDLFVSDPLIPSTTATSLPTTTATTSTTVATTSTTTPLPCSSSTTTATSTATPPPTTTSTTAPYTSNTTTPNTSGPGTSTFLTTTGASTTTTADTSTTSGSATSSSSASATASTSTTSASATSASSTSTTAATSSSSAPVSTASPAHTSTTDATSAETSTSLTSAGPTYATTTTPKTTSGPNKSREEDPSREGAAAAGDKKDDGSPLSGGSVAAVVVVAIAIVSAASAGIAFFLVQRRGRSSSLTTAFTADVGSKNAANNRSANNNDKRRGGRLNVQTTTSDNNNITVEEGGNTTTYAEDDGGGPLGDNFSHHYSNRNSNTNASFRTVETGAGAAGGAARRQKGTRGLSMITADEMVSVPAQTQNKNGVAATTTTSFNSYIKVREEDPNDNNKKANSSTKAGGRTYSSPTVNRGRVISLEPSSSYSTADGSSLVGNASRTAFEADEDEVYEIDHHRLQQRPSRAPLMPLFSHEFENTYAPPTVQTSPPASPSQAHMQQQERQQTTTTPTPTQRTQIAAPRRDGVSSRGMASPTATTAEFPPAGILKPQSPSGKPTTDAQTTTKKKTKIFARGDFEAFAAAAHGLDDFAIPPAGGGVRRSVPASPKIGSPPATREQSAVNRRSPVGSPNARGVSAVFLAAAVVDDEDAPPPLDSKRAKLLGGFGGDVYIHDDSTATE